MDLGAIRCVFWGGTGALERVGLYGLGGDLGGAFCYDIRAKGRN